MKNQFIQVNMDLLASTKLNLSQKAFISYILGWQSNGKTCFESNKKLAQTFGLTYEGIRSLIKSLNKLDFFTSIKISEEADATYTSTHTLRVDEEKLQQFLQSENKPIEAPKSKATGIPQPIQEIAEEITPIEPEASFEIASEPTTTWSDDEEFEAMMGEPIQRAIEIDEPIEGFDTLKFLASKKVRATTKITEMDDLYILNDVVNEIGVLAMIYYDLTLPTTFEKAADKINSGIKEYFEHKKAA